MKLVRNNISVIQAREHMDDSEFQQQGLRKNDFKLILMNVYSHNGKPLSKLIHRYLIVVGDFNSHSQSSEYDYLDRRGEELEIWQDGNKLILINQSDEPFTTNLVGALLHHLAAPFVQKSYMCTSREK